MEFGMKTLIMLVIVVVLLLALALRQWPSPLRGRRQSCVGMEYGMYVSGKAMQGDWDKAMPHLASEDGMPRTSSVI